MVIRRLERCRTGFAEIWTQITWPKFHLLFFSLIQTTKNPNGKIRPFNLNHHVHLLGSREPIRNTNSRCSSSLTSIRMSVRDKTCSRMTRNEVAVGPAFSSLQITFPSAEIRILKIVQKWYDSIFANCFAAVKLLR